MTFPTPTRQDHLLFCQIEGWEEVRSSRGKTGTHHLTFELVLPSGNILRTRISRPPDRTDYGPAIWHHSLTDQLKVSGQEFWVCLKEESRPERGAPLRPEGEALPTDLVWLLINRVGLSESEVRKLSKQDAVDLLNRFWTSGE